MHIHGPISGVQDQAVNTATLKNTNMWDEILKKKKKPGQTLQNKDIQKGIVKLAIHMKLIYFSLKVCILRCYFCIRFRFGWRTRKYRPTVSVFCEITS